MGEVLADPFAVCQHVGHPGGHGGRSGAVGETVVDPMGQVRHRVYHRTPGRKRLESKSTYLVWDLDPWRGQLEIDDIRVTGGQRATTLPLQRADGVVDSGPSDLDQRGA